MPTIKQKNVFKKALNGTPISKAMVEEGYSPKSNIATLTRTDGWQELVEKNLSDEKITAIHNKLLNKKESFIVSDGAKSGSHIEFTDQPHSDAARAIDMAYKLKRKYESEAVNNNVVIVNVSQAGAKKYGVNQSTGTDIV